MTRIRVGISGWRYPAWRGRFYPPGLPQARELEYVSRRMNSVEINGSFYSLQRPSSFRSWYEQTPQEFVFAVKGSRFITHMKRLRGVHTPLANFFASGLLVLAEKLGPVLWQLPPALAFDRDRLTEFLDLLPRSTAEAARLARQHDARLADRAWTTASDERVLRHAIEVRHPSFGESDCIAILRRYGAALVTADTAGRWPFLDEPTADFAYARLHGAEQLYVSGYSGAALDAWADRIRGWSRDGRDAYVYFDNDANVRAPFDAVALAERLGVGPVQ